MTLKMSVSWKPYPWYSRYQRGTILSSSENVESIYRRHWSGEVRLYSTAALDGAGLQVNGGPTMTLHARGRFGKLYIAEPAP